MPRQPHSSTPASAQLVNIQQQPLWWRVLWAVGVMLIVAGACAFLDLHGFDNLEAAATHLREGVAWRRFHTEQDATLKRIVIVPFSDATFAKFPGPPLLRECHAKVLRELKHAGAALVAFDVIFDREKPADAEFARAARDFGPVVWAMAFEEDGTGKSHPVLPNAMLRAANPYYGHIQFPLNTERPEITRAQAVIEYAGDQVPALSIQIARVLLGLQHQPLVKTRFGWRAGRHLFPTDADGTFTLSYFGPPEVTFPLVPYEDILQGAVDDPFYRDSHFFKDKIVLIGDTTTISNDHKPTPMGEMAGVEIHAHALATVLLNSFVRIAPHGMQLAMLCLLIAVTGFSVFKTRITWAALIVLTLALGYFMFNVWLFVDYQLSLHLAAPLIGIVFTALGTLVERGVTEEREKRRMVGMLMRYVSPKVAEFIIRHPGKCTLGGERIRATVLFSDIRGFTTLSETMTPEEVAGLLNEYFQAMSDIVFRHDGTIDKYIGDAVMALFGIPVASEDHAYRAVQVAWQMRKALAGLQVEWTARGLPAFDIGIGINTGEMVVGNIGARQRQDFTVIGDAVNHASRLESLNKELQTHILIASSTYHDVKELVTVNGPQRVKIRGEHDECDVYELTGFTAAPAASGGKEAPCGTLNR